MCNLIRRFFGISNFTRFSNESDPREARANRIDIHQIISAPQENIATGRTREIKYLEQSKLTPLLQKILNERKSRDQKLLERNNLSTEEYRVCYEVQGSIIEKNAIKKTAYNVWITQRTKIFTEALNCLKEYEKIDRANKDRTFKSFVESCLQTMVDDENKRTILASGLDDNRISSDKFLSFSQSTDNDLFYAHFNNIKIELSNRGGDLELRGNRLKEVMSKYTYSSLNDLFSQIYLTEDDHQMAYLVNGILKANISAKCQECNLSKEQIDNIKRKLENVKFRGVPLIKLIPHYFLYD